jgi:hypothetical protein
VAAPDSPPRSLAEMFLAGSLGDKRR